MILGIGLFLYGANYYNEVVGWAGVFLFVGSIVGWIMLSVYRWLIGRKVKQESPVVQNP